jgi:hypothetical protein
MMIVSQARPAEAQAARGVLWYKVATSMTLDQDGTARVLALPEWLQAREKLAKEDPATQPRENQR